VGPPIRFFFPNRKRRPGPGNSRPKNERDGFCLSQNPQRPPTVWGLAAGEVPLLISPRSMVLWPCLGGHQRNDARTGSFGQTVIRIKGAIGTYDIHRQNELVLLEARNSRGALRFGMRDKFPPLQAPAQLFIRPRHPNSPDPNTRLESVSASGPGFAVRRGRDVLAKHDRCRPAPPPSTVPSNRSCIPCAQEDQALKCGTKKKADHDCTSALVVRPLPDKPLPDQVAPRIAVGPGWLLRARSVVRLTR